MPPAPSRVHVLASRPAQGHLQRWSLWLCLGLLVCAAAGCRPGARSRPQAPASGGSVDASRQHQQQAAIAECRQRRQRLEQGLAELRRAEAALAEARGQQPPPLPAAPVWDEMREQRYSEADQQLDRQRFEQQLAAWQQRQAERAVLIDRQRQRQAEAQQRLDRQARLLQQRHPSLFTAPTSIEVKPQELERLSRCPAEPA